jgi:hypothetical protein
VTTLRERQLMQHGCNTVARYNKVLMLHYCSINEHCNTTIHFNVACCTYYPYARMRDKTFSSLCNSLIYF